MLLHNILNEDWYKDNPFDRNELLFLLNIQKQIRSGNMNLEEFISHLKSDTNKKINEKLLSSPDFVSYKDNKYFKCKY